MASTKLKGKWTHVSIIENYGDTENETEILLDLTTGDVTIGGDENTIEGDAHADPNTEVQVISGSPFIEVERFEAEEESILEQVGILDSETGEWQVSGRGLEAVRVANYQENPANGAEPVRVYDGTDVEPEWSDDTTFPEDDFVTSGVTFHVNDTLRRNYDEEGV